MSHPSWVCGLKPVMIITNLMISQSHPSWVCGLKPFGIAQKEAKRLSHPSWVCGLKHGYSVEYDTNFDVTPFVGVWIETC